MPTISSFKGITIRMFSESGERHHSPHIHCVYAENEASIDFEGNILEGSFPSTQLKLVKEWIDLHKEELNENWKLLSGGEQHKKIAPLK